MDIRNFFGGSGSKDKKLAQPSKDHKKRQKLLVVDSDDDEEPIPPKKKKALVYDDEEVIASSPATKQNVNAAKPKTTEVKVRKHVDPSEYFGAETTSKKPVQNHSQQKQPRHVETSPSKADILRKHKRDDDHDSSESSSKKKWKKDLDGDEESPIPASSISKKLSEKFGGQKSDSGQEKTHHQSKHNGESHLPHKPTDRSPSKVKHSGSAASDISTIASSSNSKAPAIKRTKPDKSPEKKKDSPPKSKEIPKEEKRGHNATSTKKSPVKVSPPAKKGPPESSDTPQLDDSEKKKRQAFNYWKFKQKEGPKAPGSKEIPEGADNCLQGLTFVISGTLEALSRDEMTDLLKQYGGKVTSAISGKTSYLVLGDDPGQTKLDKANKLGVKQLSEDDVLDMIRRSNKSSPKKGQATSASGSSHSSPSEATAKVARDGKRSPSKDSKQRTESPSSAEKQKNKRGAFEKDAKVSPAAERKAVQKHSASTKRELVFDSPEKRSPRKDELKLKPKSPQKSSPPTPSLAKKESPEKGQRAESVSRSTGQQLWVEKYHPATPKHIIGQQGDRSCANKLSIWLRNWQKHHGQKGKAPPKPSPWAKSDHGGYFKAVLLSGSPGVGKTTTAYLVCKELGFEVIELNASDARSKKSLKEHVTELLSNKTLGFSSKDSTKLSSKHVVLMEEIDGMAGNEDRGGMAEVINLIKHSHIPILCTCNDRNHPKIRSLANYCFDLRFTKPRVEQIRAALMSICFKEKIQIKADAIDAIILGCNQDIRQSIHHLALFSSGQKSLSKDDAKSNADKAKKDIKLGPWDVIRKVFSAEDHRSMSIHDKSDLFFYDYSLCPLFVQENYIIVSPSAAKHNVKKSLELLSQAADNICNGDLVDRLIRTSGSWNLLPVEALYASVLPGQAMEGHFTGQINFPSWFGKNSKQGKMDRLLQEMQMHMRLSTTGGKQAVNQEYLRPLRDSIVRPLSKHGADGVADSLKVIEHYNLLREDIDNISELTTWPGMKDPFKELDGKVKAAFTRAYNKEGFLLPFPMAMAGGVKKAGRISQTEENDLEERVIEDAAEEVENEEEGSEDEGDITADKSIKAKKPAAKKKAATDVPSTSRGPQKKGKDAGKAGKGKSK